MDAVLDKLYGKVGTNKSYISRIEKGALEPGVGLFFRIIDALGLKVEIVKPMIFTKYRYGQKYLKHLSYR